MEQQRTPLPSIASLHNSIQHYSSPSPSHKTTTNNNNNNLSKRKRSHTGHPSPSYNSNLLPSQNLNQSILFNPNPHIHPIHSDPAQPFQRVPEPHPMNNSFTHHHHHHPSNNQLHHQAIHHQHPSTSSSHQSSSSSPPTAPALLPSTTVETDLEHSIFGIAPYDQFTWSIAQFIWQHARPYWENGQAHLVEVEAKLGTIRDKRNQGDRMYYPIGTESPILDTRDTKFLPDMSIQQHENLNRILNQRVTESNSAGYLGASVDYLHTRQIDEFFDSQVRVTRDWGNDKGSNANINQSVPRSIVKEKLAHLDIHCPGRPFDFRISVNVEQPVPLPHQNSPARFQRIKDRLSYTHQVCQIDLTQVKTSEQNGPSTHEVEVEFKNSKELLKAASIWSESHDPNHIDQKKKGKQSEELEGLFGGEEEEEDSDDVEEKEEGVSGRRNASNSAKSKKMTSKNGAMDSNHYLLMVEVFLNNIRMLILNC